MDDFAKFSIKVKPLLSDHLPKITSVQRPHCNQVPKVTNNDHLGVLIKKSYAMLVSSYHNEVFLYNEVVYVRGH